MDSLAYYVTLMKKDFSRFCSKRLEAYQITGGMLYHFIYIGKRPECSTGELSENLHADQAQTTRIITRLEQLGYVRRTQKEADKRVILLRLTPEGEAVFAEIKGLFAEWDTYACGRLTPEKRAELYSLLAAVRDGLGGFGYV